MRTLFAALLLSLTLAAPALAVGTSLPDGQYKLKTWLDPDYAHGLVVTEQPWASRCWFEIDEVWHAWTYTPFAHAYFDRWPGALDKLQFQENEGIWTFKRWVRASSDDPWPSSPTAEGGVEKTF